MEIVFCLHRDFFQKTEEDIIFKTADDILFELANKRISSPPLIVFEKPDGIKKDSQAG
jgi:hypothetical protein